jgi:hypothetical protein
MSPSSLSGNPRVVRPWLAAALMMTVWLAAAPARCDPGPDPDRGAGAVRLATSTLAATTLAGPAWHWLQQAWAELRAWSSGGAREWQGSRPARLTAGGWQDLGNAGSSTPDDGSGGGSAGTGSGSGGTGSGGSDPNG